MVHIIPLSVAKRRPDTGKAGQPPQRALTGVATRGYDGDLQELAAHYERRMAQQEAFDTELIARRFNGQVRQAEDEAAAKAPADGRGLHEAMYGELDPHTGQVAKAGLFDAMFEGILQQVPESQRGSFIRQGAATREAGSLRMAARQLQQRKDYEQAEVDTALKTSAIAIGNADPDDHPSFEAARQQGLDLIDKMGVDPGIRQELAKDWFGTAAKTRLEALIAKDPKRALAMFGVGGPAVGRDGDAPQAEGSPLADGPMIAGGKQGRVGIQTPDERIAQAYRDDLPQQEQEALALKAKVAKFTQDINLRVAISRAEAEAPDEIARTGSYSGSMPGRDAYRTIYGLDEGDRRRKAFEWQTDVGKQIFDMGTMPNPAIHAALRDAEAGPNTSLEDQASHEATALAAKLVLERRRADPGGYVTELSPEISEGWKAVLGNGSSDPAAYDQDTYDRTIDLSVAQQKALGVDDEDLQPVPFSILLKLADDRDSGGMDFMDNYAKASALFARTKGPVARAALVRELDDAGLGGILPGGKPGLSAGEVLQADAQALGKVAANAGIFAGKLAKGVGYGISLGSIDPPDFSHGYYEPANSTEKVMMRQGNDALGWAIPGPGVGRTVAAKGIPRSLEPLSALEAGRAEGLAAKELPGELSKEGAGLVEGGSGTRQSDVAANGKSAGKDAQPTVALDLPSGSFSMSDWADYPIAVVPKPEGPFIRLDGTEHKAARKAADKANRIIRRKRGLVGQPVDVHEVKPVKFGGSPTDASNKVILPREVHQQQVTPWWNKLLKDIGE